MAAILGSIGVTFTGDTGAYAAAVQRVQTVTDRAMSGVRSSVGLTERSVQSLHRTMGAPIRLNQIMAATRGFEGLNTRLNVLRGSVLAVTAIFGGFTAALAANAVLRYADTYTQLNNQLRVVSATAGILRGNLVAIEGAANDARAGLAATATLFSRLQKASPETPRQDVLDYVVTIQKALALGGATAQEAASAALQFSQAIASNRLGGEELRAILETPLGLELAKGLDVSIGKLREMSIAGELTSERVLGALKKIKPGIDTAFALSTATLDQQLVLLDNALITSIGHLNDAYGVTRLLGQGVNSLARNAETLIPLITLIGVGLGTIFLGRFAATRITGAFGAIRENNAAIKRQIDELTVAQNRYRDASRLAAAEVSGARALGGGNLVALAPQSNQSALLRAQQAELALQKQIAQASQQVTAARTAARNVVVADVSDNKKILDSKKAEQALDTDRLNRQAALARSYKDLAATVAAVPASATAANQRLIGTETRLATLEANRIRIARDLAAAHTALAAAPLVTATSSAADVNNRRGAVSAFNKVLAEQARNEAQITAVTEKAVAQRTRLHQIEGAAEGKALQQQAAIRRSIIQQEGQLNAVYAKQAVQDSATRTAAQRAESTAVVAAVGARNKSYGAALKAGLTQSGLQAQASLLAARTVAAEAAATVAGQRSVAAAISEATAKYSAYSGAVRDTSVQLLTARRSAGVLQQGFGYLKSAGLGLLGAIGGPFGLALIAGIVGLEVWAAKSAAAAQKTEEYRQAILRAAKDAPGIVGQGARQAVVDDAQKQLEQRQKDLETLRQSARTLFGVDAAGKQQVAGALPANFANARTQLLGLIDALAQGGDRQKFVDGLDRIAAAVPGLRPRINQLKGSLDELQGAFITAGEAQKNFFDQKFLANPNTREEAVARFVEEGQRITKAIDDEVAGQKVTDLQRTTLLRVQGYDAQALAIERLRKVQAAAKSAGTTVPNENALPKFTALEQQLAVLAEVGRLSQTIRSGKGFADITAQVQELTRQLVTGGLSFKSFNDQIGNLGTGAALAKIASLTQDLKTNALTFADYQVELTKIGTSQPDLRKLIEGLTTTKEAAVSATDILGDLGQSAAKLDGTKVTIGLTIAGTAISSVGDALKNAYEDARKQIDAVNDLGKELDITQAKARGLAAGGETLAKIEETLAKLRAESAVPLGAGTVSTITDKTMQIANLEAIMDLQKQLSSGKLVDTQESRDQLDALSKRLVAAGFSLRDLFSEAQKFSFANAVTQINGLTQKLIAGTVTFADYKFELAKISANQPDLRTLINGLILSEDAAKAAGQELSRLSAQAQRLDKTKITILVDIVTSGAQSLFAPFERAFSGAIENFKKQAESVADVQKQFDEARAKKRGFDTGGEIGAKVEAEIARLRAAQGVPFAAGAEEQLRRQLTEIENINKAISEGTKEAKKENKEFERTAEILDRIRREGEGAFLGDIDREVIAKTAKIQNAAVLVRQYIAAIESGDLTKAPQELLQVREALLQVGAADAYRDIIKNMGEGAQLTQLFADKQAQLQFLLSKGKITAGQYAQSWTEFVTSFGQYKWIDDVTQAFNQFGMSAITDFENIGKAVDSLKNQLLNVIVQTFVMKPLMDQFKSLMVGVFAPAQSGAVGAGALTSTATMSVTAGVVNVGGVGLGGIAGLLPGSQGAANSNVLPAGVNAAQMNGGGPGASFVGAVPMAGAANASAAMGKGNPGFQFISNPKVDLAAAAQAIKNIESSGGNYGALGDITKNGDRGYGAYQVMGNNVPSWTKRWTGTEMTKDQFLANKNAQDQVFEGQFGMYAKKYGPEGASQAWLGGEGSVGKLGRVDMHGTSVGGYGSAFSQDYAKLSQNNPLAQMPGALDKLGPSAEAATKSVTDLGKNLTTTVTPAITDMTKSAITLPAPLTTAATSATSLSSAVGSGGGGLAGAFQSLLSFFGFGAPAGGAATAMHSGGKVGAGGMPRSVGGSWAGAPRFHEGLAPNEMKAILLRGESVLTENMTKRTGSVIGGLSASAAGGGGGNRDREPKVIINAPPGHEAETKTQQGVDGYEVVVGFVSTATARGRFDAPNSARYSQKPRKVS